MNHSGQYVGSTPVAKATFKLWNAVQGGQDGITVALDGSDLPASGYFVGGASWSLVRARELVTFKNVYDFVQAHPDAAYIGYWLDNGRAYLDVCDHEPSPFVARQLATDRHELSFYDASTGTCITV